jgi:hypothetical protein
MSSQDLHFSNGIFPCDVFKKAQEVFLSKVAYAEFKYFVKHAHQYNIAEGQ